MAQVLSGANSRSTGSLVASGGGRKSYRSCPLPRSHALNSEEDTPRNRLASGVRGVSRKLVSF